MISIKIRIRYIRYSIILGLSILFSGDHLFSQDISNVQYEVTKIREVPSANPQRTGKIDLMISYSIDGKPASIIALPKEETTP